MISGLEELVATPAGDVSLALDGSPTADLLILAHGAGAGMHHPFMKRFAEGCARSGIATIRFNFRYAELGRKAPDRQPILEQTYDAVVEHVRSRLSPTRLFLGGKSMGGRIASHLPRGGTACDGLVFLGYPLHPPGRPDRVRDAHLHEVRVPMLFVEGTRDPFCPLETLERVRAGIPGSTTLAIIDDGDHSFAVRRSSGRTSADALQEAIEAVAAWIATL